MITTTAGKSLEQRIDECFISCQLGPTGIDFLRAKSTRALDVMLSLIASTLSPLPAISLIEYIALWATDGQPVIIKLPRPVTDKIDTKVLKFRTQPIGVNPSQGKTAEKVPTTGPVADICRKYSLDEIARLASVLKGDLTLVGPDLFAHDEFAEIRDHNYLELRAQAPRIGAISPYHVLGRDSLSLKDRVRADKELLKRLNFPSYFNILFQTFLTAIPGTGR